MQSVYYNTLGGNKRIYDAALQCFQNRGRSFPVTGSIPAAELAIEVLNDHPEIFYVGQEFRVMSSLMRRDIMPVYLYSPAEASKIRNRLDDVAQRIIDEHINDHQSDYDKVRSLHDYLKSNLEYDTVAASSHRPNERNIAEAHNIIGALLKNKCVCEGFAKAFKFLCDKIGLECWVVSGKGSSSIGAGPHAWNIVKINGYYHHVDVTWDNQYSDSSAVPNYGYMNLSDEEIAKDHTWKRNLAVVINKVDIPTLEEKIGETAAQQYLAENAATCKNYMDARDAVCRNFLEEYGAGNFVRTAEAKFKTVRYFTCSALGHNHEGQPYEGKNVTDPVMWLLQQSDSSIKAE